MLDPTQGNDKSTRTVVYATAAGETDAMNAVIRALVIWGVGAAVAGAREWTSVSGTKLEADFVRVTGDMVTLKKPDGQVIGIRKQFLSADDQAFIQEQAGGAPAAQKIELTGLSSRASLNTSIMLSEADLASLKSEITDEKSGNLYSFSLSGALDRTSSKNKNWKEGKSIDVKLTATCYRKKPVSGGRFELIRESGTCYFYLTDSEDKPVLTKSKSLDSMCPT